MLFGKPDSAQWHCATDWNEGQKPGLSVGVACGQAVAAKMDVENVVSASANISLIILDPR